MKPREPPSRHRLLIVDDEQPIIFALKSYFATLGYDVDVAQELDEARALVEAKAYSAVIADLRLGETSGTEGLGLVSFVRELAPETRIILLTAYGSKDIEAKAFQLGADVFLHKPEPLSKIAELLRSLVASEPQEAPHPDSKNGRNKTIQSDRGRRETMQPRKILVVDDSKLIHKMFEVLLRQFPLIHAHDGLEALQCLGNNADVDLILLDINMPRMSGLEFLNQVKADHAFQQIPVVIISTEGKEEDTLRGLEAGASAYIKKPFGNQELLETISRL